ncbi:phosphoethanolamine N-methyltransferase 1-like [Dendronephthya gigantea]|uniref:phosphoethanolamine N-methyltransferase 1-like n=1 Tax=Dendronephthya gigantea TaxID=151771 RepID=UPI00106C7751|nr:phosphoethanolamine N-methyltransferase 1-like [Dendronephthya gigantea]
MASLYSVVSSRQFQSGRGFLEKLELKPGDKVIDMGCGTGKLTKYIAEQVGDIGEVIGVDPDSARIEFAKENTNTICNVCFHEGDSKSGFPYQDEAHYDLHFSNYVYHWLSDEEKGNYVNLASRCLKPGGLIAIQCLAASGEATIDSLSRSANVSVVDSQATRELLHDCGFTDINIMARKHAINFILNNSTSLCINNCLMTRN